MSVPGENICGTHSCGNHGSCNYETYKCDCERGWTGIHCTIPPPKGSPCQPSSDEFREEYGGDLSCGNLGNYGKCEATGLCTCPFGLSGERCEISCDPNADINSVCGGPNIGHCNLYGYNTCSCINGWSGADCRTPPATPCEKDSDCGLRWRDGRMRVW